jgi:hypothetical protein
MNWAFVVGTYGANPVDTAALRLSLNVWPTLMHAQDDRPARAPFCEMLAANAMAIRTLFVEEAHG